MSEEILEVKERKLKVSKMAENLIGSEIITLAWQINEMIAKGKKISNLTIGDFDPDIFTIPKELKEEIKKAYDENQTNYPPADGTHELRRVISSFLYKRLGLEYGMDEILITSGARPIIFAAYNTIVDLNETVIFPVPSWNNNHYAHLTRAKSITVETKPENNFMPTASDLEPHIKKANLISLCSPLNPTGTVFKQNEITDICDLILNENCRRSENEKPVYLLFDQIYWLLTLGETQHFNPVVLCPEMRNYTVFVDGMSKAFAGTGVRVGWGYGPKSIIDKMKSITSHMGAWAPKAEQVAISRYLGNDELVDSYLGNFKGEIIKRLNGFYKGFKKLKDEGFNVDAIEPQASIFMTVYINLIGKKKKDGNVIRTTKDITNFLIDDAMLALVPFSSFGASNDSVWYRISVGTCSVDEIERIIVNLRTALSQLS